MLNGSIDKNNLSKPLQLLEEDYQSHIYTFLRKIVIVLIIGLISVVIADFEDDERVFRLKPNGTVEKFIFLFRPQNLHIKNITKTNIYGMQILHLLHKCSFFNTPLIKRNGIS
jgi:hypothetical protein